MFLKQYAKNQFYLPFQCFLILLAKETIQIDISLALWNLYILHFKKHNTQLHQMNNFYHLADMTIYVSSTAWVSNFR